MHSLPPTPSQHQCWAGVDWLTLTAPDPSLAPDLRACGVMAGRLEEEQGASPHPWRWRGYTGEEWPHIRWGDGPQGAILQIWGALADDLCDWLLAGRWSVRRVDYQVTHKVDPPRPDVHRVGLAALQAAGELYRRRASWQIIEDDLDGNGLHIGRRSSRRYLRLYHKEVQSGDGAHEGCWRWEVEYKREYAVAAARRIANCGRRADSVAGTVCAEFQRWGIPVEWRDECDGRIRGPRRESTDDTAWLNWLNTRVVPSIRKRSDPATRKAAQLILEQALFDGGKECSNEKTERGRTLYWRVQRRTHGSTPTGCS